MQKVNLYSTKAKKAGTFTLPKGFSGKMNESLLAQAIHVYRDRMYSGTSKAKTRSEVAMTSAKWYRQKGTGRARHGAKSAPIFVGGGVAHGPKGVKRTLELPKKMRRAALASALSLKVSEKKVAAVADLAAISKTKDAQALVDSVRAGEKLSEERMTFVVSDKNRGLYKFMKNIKKVNVESFSDLNVYKVYFGGYLIVDKEIFKTKK